jgi:hypothetical protein
MLACASPTSNNNPLGTGFGPARADCGFREPLAPRLARPGKAMVPVRFAATLRRLGAHSSAGERPLHTREVPGSIPGAPTSKTPANRCVCFGCGRNGQCAWLARWKASGKVPTWLGARVTAASLLIAEGLNVVFVSRQLGHASPDVTLRVYAHLFDRAEHGQRASDALEAGFGEMLDRGIRRQA